MPVKYIHLNMPFGWSRSDKEDKQSLLEKVSKREQEENKLIKKKLEQEEKERLEKIEQDKRNRELIAQAREKSYLQRFKRWTRESSWV